MRKRVLADFPLRPPARGVATSVYAPGLSILAPTRPVKEKR